MEKTLKQDVGEFIIKNFMKGRGPLADDDSLFASNIIDSFGLLDLIAFIEKKYKIRVGPSEVTINNFDSLNKIVRLVELKQARVQKP